MKKVVYSLVSPVIVWGCFCMMIIADQTQLPSSSLFNQARIGFGFAAEYINVGVNFKVKPVGSGLDNLPSTMGVNQSHIGRALQIAPCIELGAIIANCYYFGLHASWRSSSVVNKTTTPIRRSEYFLHEIRVDHYADLLLKTGYKLTPRMMIYSLVGPSLAKWHHTTDQLNERNNSSIDRFRIDKKSLGLGIGLGFEYLFKKKYAFSFDYTHHFHKSVSQTMNITIPDIGPRRSGDLLKTIQPSYGVLAARFTVFFNL
ncbi:MAG: hypothetical protein ACOH2E_06580 [Candidatus Paracaedibacter sp.]